MRHRLPTSCRQKNYTHALSAGANNYAEINTYDRYAEDYGEGHDQCEARWVAIERELLQEHRDTGRREVCK